MTGFVYCRYCDYSSSAQTISAHEQGCEQNPDYVEYRVVPPSKPGHVASDHFLRSFDRYPEGEQRLRAMAAHCALIYNNLQDERTAYDEMLEWVIGHLSAQSSPVWLALELKQQLDDR